MLKILLVDDCPQTRGNVKNLIHSGLDIPFVIFEADDGYHAIQVFEEELPDLIITDICMPNVDGYELIIHIRHRSNVPIIAMSSGSFANQLSQDVFSFAEGLGANFTLSKMNGLNELPQLIDVVLYMALKHHYEMRQCLYQHT